MTCPWETVYDAEKHPNQVFNCLSAGKTPAQCAKECNITLEMLKEWSTDSKKPEFVTAFSAGQTYFRAFWEDYMYNVLVAEEPCSSVQEKLLNLVLKTQLLDVWNEKALDMSGEIDEVSRLTDEELLKRIEIAISERKTGEL